MAKPRRSNDPIPAAPARRARSLVLRPHLQPGGSGPAFPVVRPSSEQTPRRIHRYGWLADHPDPRDHVYAGPVFRHPLPPRIDLRPAFARIPPYDQGQLGSCTGNAIAAAVQFDRVRQRLPQATRRIPSRLFIYYCERRVEGTVDSDAGAQIRDGIKAVATYGVCFESGPDAWPYDITRFKDAPPPKCYRNAARDRVVSYSRLHHNLDQMKRCLASGFPFVFGFTAFEEFEGPEVQASGKVSLPASGARPIGCHAVLAVGYDDDAQEMVVRNSWGPQWGMQGYFTLPYSYISHPGLASDFWTLRLIAPD